MMLHRASVISGICSVYDHLSDREKLIADYVMANQNDIPFMTTREIASGSNTSAATVSRFVRHLGFESFSGMRNAMQRDSSAFQAESERSPSAVSLAAPRAAMETVIMAKNQELMDTLELIDEEELVHAVKLISQSVSIVFGAVGNSIPACMTASFLFSQLGLRAHSAANTEAMMLSTYSLTPQDVLLFISKSGHSKRLNQMMDNALDSETPTIVITNRPDSPLAERATCVLHAATRDKMLNNSMPFSHNSINYIIEVLFLLLCSDTSNFDARAGLMWKTMGEDKGVDSEIFS